MNETKWLIAREIPRLRRYALALARDPVAADDLVQDTLERAIRKRHLWSRSGSVRNWLYRILYNVFLNQTDKRRRVQQEVELDQASAPVEPSSAEQIVACRDIVAAMQLLPAEQRAAIALTAIEGLAYDEAAAVLGVPIGTLRSRLSRGRDRLRELCQVPKGRAYLRRVK
jgi:RNA polymerase sigma-70 factor (ECF subfamily)